ncbi:MAG: hypothetical protein E7122_03920 [Bacteroidales bacterium]|nr:hypothetical protein [Bacteroidales bacterium]
MKTAVKLITLLVSLAAGSQHLYAQQEKNAKGMFENFSKLLSPEKVYLHTDKDVYHATDTIWISGYVENSSYAGEFAESNYIYVELIADYPKKEVESWNGGISRQLEVVERKKLRRFGNTFSGYMVVPEMSSTSKAVLRGYTYWMLNSPVEYMFYKQLEITNPMKDRFISALKDARISSEDTYLLFGAVPEKKQTKKMSAEAVHEDYDVQFLPESGNYIVGSDATIFIKGIGANGKGKALSGSIVSHNGKHLASFTTDPLGFGKVLIKNLPAGKMMASVADSHGIGKNFQLPPPLQEGVTINGRLAVSGGGNSGDNDKISFRIFSSGRLLARGLYAVLQNGSEVYSQMEINSSQSLFSLPLKGLEPGIHTITVADSNGNVYAQRPFAVLPCGNEVMEIDTEKDIYGKREKVTVNVSIPRSMIDSCSNFSVSVTDMGLTDNVEKTTIESYMLLKSELNGYIENIEWYFDRNVPYASRMARADMLMQTQGWRYYEMENILKGENTTPVFGKEYVQTIAGKVMGVFGISKKAFVTFYAPSINFSAMGQLDSGYFVLKDVDFPEKTKFIVSATGKNGKNMSHTPILQKDYFAPIYRYPILDGKVTYSARYREIVEKKYYNSADGAHSMAFTLDPVVVTSQLITPANSPSPIPNRPIKRSSYRDAQAMKPYMKGYDLASYVLASFAGVRRSQIDGMLLGNTGFNNWKIVELYINGTHIHANEVLNGNLLQMPLYEVESLIYLNGLDASPFQPVHLHLSPVPSPVLMINTVSGGRGNRANPNTVASAPIGWQKPARFYSPKYDYMGRGKGEDNRITLYWSPSIKVDKSGKASFSFYTSDSTADFRIEVEGRSAAGKYHAAEKIVVMKK